MRVIVVLFIHESNLSPAELEFVRTSSERLIAIWSITKTKILKKGMNGSLLVKHSIENFLSQVTDPNEIALYKEFVNHPEARRLFNWAASSIDGNLSQGKILNEFSPEDILSQEVKYMLNQLKENMGYTADAYEYAAVPYMESMLRAVLDDFYFDVQNNSNLTVQEKGFLYAEIATQHELLLSIIYEAKSQVAYEETKTNWNWRRFGRKLVSIGLHIVIVGVACAVIGVTIGLTLPVVLTIGAWQVSMASAGLAIGGAIGLSVGIVAALADQCLDMQNYAYYSC